MRRCIPIMFAFLPLTGAGAMANETSDMEAVLRSKICPSSAVQYHNVAYDDWCKGVSGGALGIGNLERCQNKVDHANRLIDEYNAFVRRCRLRPASSGGLRSTKAYPAAPAPQIDHDDISSRLRQAEAEG